MEKYEKCILHLIAFACICAVAAALILGMGLMPEIHLP